MRLPQIASYLPFVAIVAFADDYFKPLGETPQMGWNTWNHFGCSISEDTIYSAAVALVETGLKDLGYQYVLIDDCWHAAERANITNKPVADPVKFPHGIKALADKVHDLGLKIGIYSDAGTYTCGGRFGSLGYEQVDAETYAEWGIDYLKYDNCFNEGLSGTAKESFQRYATMSEALKTTKRPIFYSICNWGEDGPWNWAQSIANSWRISGDIVDYFDYDDSRCPCKSVMGCKNAGHHCSVTKILDYAAPVVQYSKPGGWNDLDMLEVGNGNMTYNEYVTHFSMWALMKSPLILGNDLTNMTQETFSIITNDAIIGINQDPLGISATRRWKRYYNEGSLQLWSGPLTNGNIVIALVNTSPTFIYTTVSLGDIPALSDNIFEKPPSFRLYDLWRRDENNIWGYQIGTFRDRIPEVFIEPHQTKVWRLEKISKEASLMVMRHPL